MKNLFIAFLILQAFTCFSQNNTAALYPQVQEREDDFSMNTCIAYKGGVLKASKHKKGLLGGTIKLNHYKKDGTVINNIDFGFDPASNIGLIGMFSMNDQPVIFYSQFTTSIVGAGKLPLEVKAIVLDPLSLKILKTVTIKKMKAYEDVFSSSKVYTDNTEFWYSGHEMKMKYLAGEKKFILFFKGYEQKYDSQKKYWVSVIDENMNVIIDKEDNIKSSTVSTVSFLDFYCLHNNVYIIYQTGSNSNRISNELDLYREACYFGEFKTVLRTYNISSSEMTDQPFDRSFRFIKLAKFIYDNNRKRLLIGGVYSTLWESKIDGGFFAALATGSNKPETLKVTDFESTDYLTYNFNQYKGSEKEIKNDIPQRNCDKPKVSIIFSGVSETGAVDFIFDISIVLGLRYGGLLVMNLTPAGVINFNYVARELRMPFPDDHHMSYYGAGGFAAHQKNKLVLFLNDNLLNTGNNGEPPAVTRFEKNHNWGLFEVVLDESRKPVSKKLVIDNTTDRYIAATRRFWPGGENDIYFMAGTVKKGGKEFRLGLIQLISQ